MGNRADSFHIDQVWQTSRGTLWRVVGFMGSSHPKVAVLRLGKDGAGRKTIRAIDQGAGWVLISDEGAKNG